MELHPICANWSVEKTNCKKTGQLCCENCRLLTVGRSPLVLSPAAAKKTLSQYCGPECQKAHWTVHKVDCRSYLGKSTWQPDWVLENRTPAFVGDGPSQAAFGGQKYLWGNAPALDVLQLGANEGEDYDRQISLLFAASGDLRNVVKTIAQVPSRYDQAIQVTINDRDLHVVARNVILLRVALLVDDVDKATDCIIHVWYSALIRKSDLDILRQKIRPMIVDVCQKTQGKSANSLLAKTWTLGRRSLRLVLQKSAWDALLTFIDTPEGLTAERANDVRRTVTLAEDRKDFRDRHLLFQADFHRVALTRFREDGLLLPFGAPRDEFQHPNPTLFHKAQSWCMPDNADPLTGWTAKEVHETLNGPASADIYGKLFIYLRTLLSAFLRRLSCSQISFLLHHVDAAALHNYLDKPAYSRIEVSNIADAGYLGIYRTLNCLIPLLQRPRVNPHATLITLFMNAVDENITDAERESIMRAEGPTMKRILGYLTVSPRQMTPNDPVIIKILAAWDSVSTHDSVFDRYTARYKFTEAAELVGVTMKKNHTVIEKWPFRLKLRPGLGGAQEEFDRLIGGGVSSKECYLEWRRQ